MKKILFWAITKTTQHQQHKQGSNKQRPKQRPTPNKNNENNADKKSTKENLFPAAKVAPKNPVKPTTSTETKNPPLKKEKEEDDFSSFSSPKQTMTNNDHQPWHILRRFFSFCCNQHCHASPSNKTTARKTTSIIRASTVFVPFVRSLSRPPQCPISNSWSYRYPHEILRLSSRWNFCSSVGPYVCTTIQERLHEKHAVAQYPRN